MKFGKVNDPSTVDFSFPADPASTTEFLKELKPPAHAPQLYTGCTGWSKKEWVGTVYPMGTKSKDFLKHYTKQFNTLEMNTTHYRIPTPELVQKWKSDAAEGFRFCPKIPQSISHSRDLGFQTGNTTLFCESIQLMEEKLGCCFMQMPPYFGADRLPQLRKFVEQFPDHIPLAMEVRHESWYQGSNLDRLTDVLEKNGIATVITDVAGRRDVLHQRITTNIAMIRFVGNGLIQSDYERTDEWVTRFKSWYDQNLSAIYFFSHQPDDILAPSHVKYLNEQAAEHIPNLEKRGPNLHQQSQMSLFD